MSAVSKYAHSFTDYRTIQRINPLIASTYLPSALAHPEAHPSLFSPNFTDSLFNRAIVHLSPEQIKDIFVSQAFRRCVQNIKKESIPFLQESKEAMTFELLFRTIQTMDPVKIIPFLQASLLDGNLTNDFSLRMVQLAFSKIPPSEVPAFLRSCLNEKFSAHMTLEFLEGAFSKIQGISRLDFLRSCLTAETSPFMTLEFLEVAFRNLDGKILESFLRTCLTAQHSLYMTVPFLRFVFSKIREEDLPSFMKSCLKPFLSPYMTVSFLKVAFSKIQDKDIPSLVRSVLLGRLNMPRDFLEMALSRLPYADLLVFLKSCLSQPEFIPYITPQFLEIAFSNLREEDLLLFLNQDPVIPLSRSYSVILQEIFRKLLPTLNVEALGTFFSEHQEEEVFTLLEVCLSLHIEVKEIIPRIFARFPRPLISRSDFSQKLQTYVTPKSVKDAFSLAPENERTSLLQLCLRFEHVKSLVPIESPKPTTVVTVNKKKIFGLF
ncbi:MAG: hypothetical protein WCP39_04925 [Chlamydiota bacterium]